METVKQNYKSPYTTLNIHDLSSTECIREDWNCFLKKQTKEIGKNFPT